MASKTQIISSLINHAEAIVNHVNPEATPITHLNPEVSPITFVFPVVAIKLILDSKNKLLSDVLIITDGGIVSITKNFVETVNIVNEIVALGTNKPLVDSVTPVDVIGLGITIPFIETVAASDQILENTNTLINDSLLNSHALLQGSDQELVDNITIRLN